MIWINLENRLKKVVLINVGLILLLFSYYKIYTEFNVGIPCLFKLITGYDCPGCGITRCLFSLINLDIKSAFNYNALVTILIVPFIIYYSYMNYCYVFGKNNNVKKHVNKISIILLFVCFVYGIIRNISI